MSTSSLSELSLTGRTWAPAQITITASAIKKTKEVVDEALLNLMIERGLTDSDSFESFRNASLKELPHPSTMADIKKGSSRICEAIEKNEKITIYGDYDVDGVCSCSILVEFLNQVGANVDFYIPHRRAEGYGLNQEAVEVIAKNASLMVTVDCGITSVDEIAHANTLGLDVIVVDHHQVPETLPEAVACLNPHRKDCTYGHDFGGQVLAAAGVAFMFACQIRADLKKSDTFLKQELPAVDVRTLLDLVALATVADMVPIVGINRILVRAGLKQMNQAKRPGLLALMKVASIDPLLINTADLGFKLGPRINARGRMDDAKMGVELMLSDNAQEADKMAAILDEANRQRRAIEASCLAEADEALQTLMQASGLTDAPPAIVLGAAHWHPGILGLVASRLSKKYHRPAIILGEGGKGSARSIAGLNLYDCLCDCEDLLNRFGGHPAAAGMTLPPPSAGENDWVNEITALRERMLKAVESRLGNGPFTPEEKPDIALSGTHISYDLIEKIESLGPFGQGNRTPLLAIHDLPVHSRRIVGEKHLKLSLDTNIQAGTRPQDAIAFGMGEFEEAIGDCVDVLAYAERNVFRGVTKVQLRIQDIRPSVVSD